MGYLFKIYFKKKKKKRPLVGTRSLTRKSTIATVRYTSKSFVPNGARVVPKRAKTICANSCQNSSGPYVILLISGVSIPDRAEPRENTELDLNKPYESLNGTNFWCQKETCQRVPRKYVPTRAKMTCQRCPKKIRANAWQYERNLFYI